MVFVLLGVGALLVAVSFLGCWLLAAGDRRLARARRALAEDHAARKRVGL
jgi:hypothetical protein